MSLVLDALRKLEREKKAGEPGVLVVGALPWEGLRPRRGPVSALAIVALLAAGGIAAAWWFSRPPRTVPAAPAPAEGPSSPARARSAVPHPAPRATATLPNREAPSAHPLRLPAQPGGARRATAAQGASAASRAPAAPREPQLNAISRQDGKPVAVIDGRLVHEGDSIDGIEVLRIGDTEVEVEIGGRRLTLRF